MFKNLIAGLIEKLATQFIGRLVTKAVTAAAVWQIAHKLMTPAQQGSWIATNSDWLSGLALAGLSMWLSKWRQDKHVEAIAVAAYSPAPLEPPTAAVAAKVAANVEAAQVLAGGGVGAGATQVGTSSNQNSSTGG